MANTPAPTKNTTAFAAQAFLSLGVSLLAVLGAIYFLDADPWPKAFLALGVLFLVTSTVTVSKCVRDAQEDSNVVSRLDQARVDKLLAEHDPFKTVA
jgi:hypothetical protein